MTHPEEVLFAAEPALTALPACEHYAGNEKFILEAMRLAEENVSRAVDILVAAHAADWGPPRIAAKCATAPATGISGT